MNTEEYIEPNSKSFSVLRFIKRLFFGLLISMTSLLTISSLLVYFCEDDVKAIIINELNKHLNCKITVEPQHIDLTIIKSFPKCALEFKEILALESKDFKSQDTLLFAKRLALEFNIKNLFNNNYTINNIELEDSKVNLKIDKYGNENYSIWKTSDTIPSSDSLAFALENIKLTNVFLNYKNATKKIKISTHLKDFVFSGKFNEANYTLKTKGLAYVNIFQIQKATYIREKQLKLDAEIEVLGSLFKIKKADTKINSTLLNSSGSFEIKDSLLALDIQFTGKNLDISSTLSLLPESFQTKFNEYESDGIFYANGECHYKIGKSFSLNSTFGIKQGSITYKPTKTKLSDVNLEGRITIQDHNSVLQLNNIHANLNTNTFKGQVELSNFNDPYIKLKVEANTNLEELISFYPIDTLQKLSGSILLNAQIEGNLNELKSNAFSPNVIANGHATLKNIKAQFKQTEKEINIPEGDVTLINRNLQVSNLKLIKGNSDVIIVGDIPNFLEYVFDSKTNLIINSTVTSQNIELEDFLFKNQEGSKESLVFIPPNVELNLVVILKKISFQKFKASQLSGKLFLKNQKIAINDVTFLAMNGNVSINAFADASGEHDIKISGDCNLSKLNIKDMFTELNNFGQTTLQDKHLKGFVTANIDFTGNWSKALQVDLNSLNANSRLMIEQGELIGFKPLESLAKYIDLKELKHIKFSALQSNLSIKNRTITLPKTSIKSTAINLDLWGSHTFDNQIDYHIQLLISELLAKKQKANKSFDEELSLVENDPDNRRSVFLLMKGNIDNPTITYDKSGAKQKIKEDIKAEKQTIKNILKEEFGLFKKDTISNRRNNNLKYEQKFQLQVGDGETKKDKSLQPKKKETDDDDF
jgi:hypothetical protein